MSRLNFKLELRGKVWVLVWGDFDCRPASDPEVQMWELIKELMIDISNLREEKQACMAKIAQLAAGNG